MTTLTALQACELRKDMQQLYDNSLSFNKFWRSYIYMLSRPKRCLRLMNFALKIIAEYNLDVKE